MTTTPADPGVTVYRTYLELDPYHEATRGLLVDAQKAHRLTMAPFAYALEAWDFFTGMSTGHADHRATHNILWAVNWGRAIHPSLTADTAPPARVRVMIQSDITPDFTDKHCDPFRDALTITPTVRQHTPNTAAGATIEYQIVANPAQTVTVNGHRRTRVATKHTDIESWWTRRATNAGLHLTTAPQIDQPGTIEARSKNVTIRHARITGKATITDPARYAAAAHTGIGKAKAYGCGLLLTR